MNKEIEIWKKVVGFEELYEVSSMGRVRSLDRLTPHINDTTRVIHSKVLKQQRNPRGYLMVDLRPLNGGKRKNSTVHRLVAIAFIPNPEEKKCVNHIDGNKANNVLSNLEWATTMENNTHALTTGLTPSKKGSLHFNAKLNESIVLEICEMLSNNIPAKIIASNFNIPLPTIYGIKSGDRWKHITSNFNMRSSK